jgi:glycosyltransferase involved in cell wall biosynthesis
LRIALLSPPWLPVPPTHYGGIEQIVFLLAEGLVDAGHDVTLFATAGSRSRARLTSTPAVPPPLVGYFLPELDHVLRCYERAREFDVVNDHCGPSAAVLGGLLQTPVVHTVHWPLDGMAGAVYERVARLSPNVRFVSISASQRRSKPHLPWVATCTNALDPSRYPFNPRRGEYLAFVGRMTPEKGCHRAIDVAREAGLPLKIAAKKREPPEQKYFREHVEPHLDGRIEYVGEVDHDAKVKLFHGARATLFPIEWEEPFGLVAIESLACGTPVVATRRGAAPEVVEHGRTGIVVDDYRAMTAALSACDRIDSRECRRAVDERFSARRMVRDYEEAYRRALGCP